MVAPGIGSTFKNVFYTLGYTLGQAEALHGVADGRSREAPVMPPITEVDEAPVPERGAASGDHVDPHVDTRISAHDRAPEAKAGAARAAPQPDAPEVALGTVIGVAATSWLLARLFRPRPIRWPRALLAGIAGTALMELAETVAARLATGPAGSPRPDPTAGGSLRPNDGSAPHGAQARHAPVPGEPLPHERVVPYGALDYAQGIATAAAYASLLYPRLPGPPLMRGLVFGALETTTAPAGGTFEVLRRLSPQIALPLEAILPATGLAARGPLAPLAFGLALGLYRDDADDE